ncbi:MAG: T9SS type A sorting domain-containing protein [Bacteroidales bacterium]|nr:T9SS type A sorting domain-containing protein [Bacteroidales bacterium]
MKPIKSLLLIVSLLITFAASAQRDLYRILNDNWQGLRIEFDINNHTISPVNYEGRQFVDIIIDGMMPSSEEGAPCLPLFSHLIEVPQCDGFDISISQAEYDTISLNGLTLMPVQPSRSKSDTSRHSLTIDNKIYSSNAFYGLETATVEAVGIARDRHLARLQFSPISYNPVTGQLVICRHAIVDVRYRNSDSEASLNLFNRYYSPHFASNAMVLNSIYPKSVRTAAPVRYLIVAHSSFRGQLNNFVQWKRRKGFITDIVYTDSAAVGSTTTSIAAFIQSQYTNATAEKPAPTYLLIVGDHEQVPAFNGTTSTSHITDLYYISWTSGDNIPDCYCGRFSAQNESQLTPQIEKTLMYEQYGFADPSFLDRAILIAGVDGGTSGDYGYTHADPAMDYAATNYINSSHGFTQVMYFKNNTSIVPNAPGVTVSSSASSNSATVRGYYNQGAGFINYSAHGSATSWGTPNFTTSHVSSMTNSQKFGLMIGNCCLTNKFETTTCFGESLLRKDNYCGAVGYIGGSNSTYWNEDFYWAVGLRSSIGPSMSMAYNSANLGAYDRLCHTHGEAYSQWALTQGAIMMVGNLAVESSSTSRKLYYWEIYHLMGDPSVMPYLCQAPQMTVAAPSIITVGTTTMAVVAAPYAYIALTDSATHTLVAASYADANGSATLAIPTTLALGNYELAASAQQYQTSFSSITVIHPSGRFPSVVGIEPSQNIEAGTTIQANLYVTNLGDSAANNIAINLTHSAGNSLSISPSTFNINNLNPGDTIALNTTIHVDGSVADGTCFLVNSTTSCDGLDQTISGSHTLRVIAPVVNVDLGNSDISIIPGGNASIVAVVSNIGHAPLVSDIVSLVSPSRLISVSASSLHNPDDLSTTTEFTLAPGASLTINYTIHADSRLPLGITVPLSIIHHYSTPIQASTIDMFVGVNPLENFENNTFHTSGWTQGTYQWTITNQNAYEGTYCLRSTSSLTHNQTAQINIAVTLTQADSISFYYKVSSETNYDKFHFLIDNNDQITQSGEVDWTRAAFLVPSGSHTLSFTYAKDGSVNRNSDCAWIDNIILPHSSYNVYFESIDLCTGDSYTIAGNSINTDNPCDSSLVITSPQSGNNSSYHIVDYSVHPSYNIEQNVAACDSMLWVDSVYTQSTDLSHVFTSVYGCDSIVLNHLTINHSYAGTIFDTTDASCYQWNDSSYLMPGSYTQYFISSEGCDSIVTLMLTFTDTNTSDIAKPTSLPDPIKVYPNPTSGILHFDRQISDVAIFDASGRLLLRQRDITEIDIYDLPNGVYILRLVIDAEGSTTIVRVVKK